MARKERKDLIKKIETHRDSKIITYICGDRPPITAQIGDDAVRPLYQHIRDLGHTKRLDLFIYSRGGAIDVPWRIVSALRQASDEWCVLIPYRSNSAATLIALGADQIVMGTQGELGPIDPSMDIKRMVPGPGGQSVFVQDSVSVEDVMAYVKFVQEKGGLNEQNTIAGALGKLNDRIDAVALGRVYRTHLHIRDVASRILLSRRDRADEDIVKTIVKTLAEQVYAHGHAIGFSAAKEIKLPVIAADEKLDSFMWDLLQCYESDLKLLSPLDPVTAVATQDRYTEDACLAVIESVNNVDEFSGQIDVRAKRQLPQTLQVSLNLNLQLPVGLNLQQLPPNIQQLLQQLAQQAQQAALQQAQQAVQQALNAQAPLLGAEASFRNARWVRRS